MRPIAARLLGVVLLLGVIAAPIAGAGLFTEAPGSVLAEDDSPTVTAIEQPAGPAPSTEIDTGGEIYDDATLTPSETVPAPTAPPEPPAVTDVPVVPADTAADPTLHTISATIDDPTTCVAGRSWWFSMSNAVAPEKNPAEISVTFVGAPAVTVPLDSPGSGAGFEAIYILSANLDATLESATAQVDASIDFSFALVKGPHCPGVPDEIATVTPTPRLTKVITAQIDDPEQCPDDQQWTFSITNPISFDKNPAVIDVVFSENGKSVGVPDTHHAGANGFTTTYVVLLEDDTLLSASATVDASVEYTFALVKRTNCTVRTPLPSITPTPSITLTPSLTPTPSRTPTLTPTLLPGFELIFATLSDATPCRYTATRWRFEIANRSDERANPVSILVTFRDGAQVTVPRSETVRDQDRALISHYDWDQNLNGTVASAQAVVFTGGSYQFVLLEGPNCFGSPTPTATATPNPACNTTFDNMTRICAVIDLKTCAHGGWWVFGLTTPFSRLSYPGSITVNLVNGQSIVIAAQGDDVKNGVTWRDYTVLERNLPPPGGALANVLTEINTGWPYQFRLLEGPGCQGVGGIEPSTATPIPTGTISATMPPGLPSATPPLTRTPYPTAPARTPTPPIGTLPATGAGDSDTSAGMMTLLALAAVVALGLAIRRRNIPA